MPWGNFLYDKGFNPAAAINKFYAVKLSGNSEEVTPITAITDRPIGWAQFGVATAEIAKGKGASVRVWGVTQAVAAGAIAIGAEVQLEADGRVTTVVGASGKRLVGRCVGSPATVAGDQIALLIYQGAGVA